MQIAQIRTLCDRFAGRMSGKFGIANGVLSGRQELQGGNIILRNEPPHDFYTCSTSARDLIAHLKRNDVPAEDLFAGRLNLPIARRDKNFKWASLNHVVTMIRNGQDTDVVDLTPYCEIIFPPEGGLADSQWVMSRGNLAVTEGRNAETELDSAAALQLTLKYPYPKKETEVLLCQSVLGARLIERMVVSSFLGLDLVPGGKIMMSYQSSCLVNGGAKAPLFSLGCLGFIAELDERTAGSMAGQIGQNPNSFLKLMLWLSGHRPSYFRESWYREPTRVPVDEYMQGKLDEDLPALRHFLLNIPREAFLAQ